MKTSAVQAVIVAGGESSRFWPLNQQHKSLAYLMGKPLMYWTLKGLVQAGIVDAVVVCSANSHVPQVVEEVNDLGIHVRFVFQEKLLGTGNALWQAKDYITKPFFAVWPNKINSGYLAKAMQEQKDANGLQAIFAGTQTSSPWDYGIARFEGNRIVEIDENPELGKEPSKIKVIGFYYLEPDFFDYYAKLKQHHEADLISAINLYLQDKKASVVLLDKDVPALKYPWEFLGILDILLRSENFEPGIHPTAQIGSNVVIRGDVHIGENTKIQDNTVIEGPCYIGKNCVLGHSNVIRGCVNIEDNVLTGAFCEIKHSILQQGVHLHSGFIGDSLIGKNCRIAAGFISANRRLDRQNIFVEVKGKKVDTGGTYCGAIIGEETQIGIQSGTMPGVLIGKNCVIGPGVQVFENIADNTTMRG